MSDSLIGRTWFIVQGRHIFALITRLNIAFCFNQISTSQLCVIQNIRFATHFEINLIFHSFFSFRMFSCLVISVVSHLRRYEISVMWFLTSFCGFSGSYIDVNHLFVLVIIVRLYMFILEGR